MAFSNGRFGAVVFDCDGLLLDTEKLWAKGEAKLFARYDRVRTSEHEREIIGKNGRELGRVLERLLDRPGRGMELVAELMEISWTEVSEGEAHPMPGAVALVESLHGRVPVGVATNAPRELARLSLRKAGLEDAFDVVVGVDDVSNPKPDPEVYLSACERMGAEPLLSVGIEDSPAGSAAARAAGLYVIGVPSISGVELDADEVVGSLENPSVRRTIAQRVGFEEGRG